MIYPRENPVSIGGERLLLKLYISTPADVANLPDLNRAAPGSDAYCVSTQQVYILDGESGLWVVQ